MGSLQGYLHTRQVVEKFEEFAPKWSEDLAEASADYQNTIALMEKPEPIYTESNYAIWMEESKEMIKNGKMALNFTNYLASHRPGMLPVIKFFQADPVPCIIPFMQTADFRFHRFNEFLLVLGRYLQ